MTISSEKSDKQSDGGGGGRRVAVQVNALDTVVGAHPEALRAIYQQSGKAADPAELGDAPRLKLLAFEPVASFYMATRPIMALLASDWAPLKAKEFDHGGNSGMNILFGKRVCRFRAEVVASEIDGAPALALTYGDKAFGNPWPVSALKDELRTVGDGVALGPVFIAWRGRTVPLLWFGLERVESA